MFEGVLVFFYSIVPVIAVTGFIPQIVKLIKDAEARKTSAVGTWVIWNIACLASVLYAVFIIEDFLFLLTAGINLACHVVVLSVILKDRVIDKFWPEHLQGNVAFADTNTPTSQSHTANVAYNYVSNTAEAKLIAANRAHLHDLSEAVH